MSESRELELRFPADSGYLRLCRLNAAAFGADLDFTVDQLDDLRLAVAEGVNWLVGSCSEGEIRLRLSIDSSNDHTELVVEGTAVPSTEAATNGEVADLVHAVLGATVDDYRLEVVEGLPQLWMTSARR